MAEFTADNAPSASSESFGRTMSDQSNGSDSNTKSTSGMGADGNAAVRSETTTTRPQAAKAKSAAAPPRQNAGQNSAETKGEGSEISRTQAFARRLNEMSEKKAREAQEMLRKEYEGHDALLDAMRKRGYEGNATEIAQALLNEADEDFDETNIADDTDGGYTEEGQTPTFAGHDFAALQWARDIIDERTFEQDLAAIKAAYPDAKENSVWEIGDVYVKLMLSGEVDAVTAYEAQRGHNGRQSRPAPPSIGPARSGGLMPDKEFYTPEEVDRLTSADYEDPKVMKRVRRSMTLWK